mgnify:CR=1 FL=1
MPSGNVHATATLVLATALGVAAHYNGLPALPLAAGALAGVILTPDLDVDRGSISQRAVRRSAGCVLGAMWAIFWRPYSLVFNHRSVWSHLPILSTAIRLAYIGLLPALVITVLVLPMPVLPAWWYWPVIGLAASDTLHWVMDGLFRMRPCRTTASGGRNGTRFR